MKHLFFYLSFAAVAAISLTACSSDDDNSGGSSTNNVTLVKPTNADKAAVISISNGGVQATSASEGTNAPTLNTVEITESDQVLLELKNNDKPLYIIDKPTISGNTYTFNSEKVKGTIQMVEGAAARMTRSTNVVLVINIKVMIDGEWVDFETASNGASGSKNTVPSTSEDIINWLARTWTITGVTFDVHVASSNVTAFKDFYSSNGMFDMEQILNEALTRDVRLTDKEKSDLKRKIKNITFTKEKLVVSYQGFNDDVAQWGWANTEKTQLKITLKSSDMGNKFINNDTKIDIAFNDNRCNLTLNVVFTDSDNKKWNASLVMHLQ